MRPARPSAGGPPAPGPLLRLTLSLLALPWTEELNCAAFVAGIVKAVLDGCGMVRPKPGARAVTQRRSRHPLTLSLCPPSAPRHLCRPPRPGQPAKVTAHTVEEKGTTLLIKFDADKIPADAF